MNDSVEHGYICPICSKEFISLEEFSSHLKGHADEENRRKADEEKQRREDQKKYDEAKLEKLKAELNAKRDEYLKANDVYQKALKEYNEKYVPISDIPFIFSGRSIPSIFEDWFY